MRSARLGPNAAFTAVAYAFVVTMLGTTLPTPLYPLYQQEIGFSSLVVTIVFAIYAFGVITSLLLFGAASDQVGRRRALLFGLALSAASAVCFLIAGGLGELVVGRVFSGLSAGLFTGTATATLVDLAGPERRQLATLVATAANIGGLGLGPLLSGTLAEFAPTPLRLVFWVDLILLLAAATLIYAIPEPVEVRRGERLRLQRLGVPQQMRATFLRAAMAAFAGFAILGLYTAVAPLMLGQLLDQHSPAISGLVVATVFASSLVGQLVMGVVGERSSLPLGCLGMIAGMVVLVIAIELSSLALMVIAGTVAGIGQGLAFRSGLAAVNREAPAERRAETVSSYFVVAYLAISVPVIGLGLAAQTWQLQGAAIVFL